MTGVCAVLWLGTLAGSMDAYPERLEHLAADQAEEHLRAESLNGFEVVADGYLLRVSGDASHAVQLSQIQQVLSKMGSRFTVDTSAVALPETASRPAGVDLQLVRSATGMTLRGQAPTRAAARQLRSVVEGVVGASVKSELVVVGAATLPPMDVFATAVASVGAVAPGTLTWAASTLTLAGRGTNAPGLASAQQLLHAVGEAGVTTKLEVRWSEQPAPWVVLARDSHTILRAGVASKAAPVSGLTVDLLTVGGSSAVTVGSRAAAVIGVLPSGHVLESEDGLEVTGAVEDANRARVSQEIRRHARGVRLNLDLSYLTEGACSAGLSSVGLSQRDVTDPADVAAVLARIEGCPDRSFDLPAALGASSTTQMVATGRWMAALADVGAPLRRIVSWDPGSRPLRREGAR